MGPLFGERLVIDRLQLPSAVLAGTPLAQLRVRQLTAAQPHSGQEGQRKHMCEFVREASIPTEHEDMCIIIAKSLLKRLRAVPAPNSFKEDTWRMVLGGMRWGGMARFTSTSIADTGICGGHNAPVTRTHVYWACPVARAVCEEMEQALGPHVQRLARRHVWLAEPPHTDIKQHIWDVVVLAAVTAMAAAHRYLISICLSQEPSISTRRIVCTSEDGTGTGSGSSHSGSEWGRTATTTAAAAAAATATTLPQPRRTAATQTQAPARGRSQSQQQQQQRHAPPRTQQPQSARAGRSNHSLAASAVQVELARGFARGEILGFA